MRRSLGPGRFHYAIILHTCSCGHSWKQYTKLEGPKPEGVKAFEKQTKCSVCLSKRDND